MKNIKIGKLFYVLTIVVLCTVFIIVFLEKQQIIDLYQKPIVLNTDTVIQDDKNDSPSIITKQDKDSTQENSTNANNINANQPEQNVEKETLNYKIKKTSEGYTITLYAILNKPEQYDEYISQLKQYKTEALNYLQSQNVNISNVNIIYEPNEANNL